MLVKINPDLHFYLNLIKLLYLSLKGNITYVNVIEEGVLQKDLQIQ